MIAQNFVEIWQNSAPWQEPQMVEQDLIIKRALIEIYSMEIIKKQLVFIGGTALNTIFLFPPIR